MTQKKDDIVDRLRHSAATARILGPGYSSWEAFLKEAADTIESLRRPAWRPIGEAPRDGTPILIRNKSGYVCESWWDNNHQVWGDPMILTSPPTSSPSPASQGKGMARCRRRQHRGCKTWRGSREMSDRQRWKDQPALARAAETVCLTYLTDGFCHPKDRPTCKCWDAASAVMQATGLSARAAAWVFSRRHAIEEQAEKDETKTWNGTPWWSRKEAEGSSPTGEQVRAVSGEPPQSSKDPTP